MRPVPATTVTLGPNLAVIALSMSARRHPSPLKWPLDDPVADRGRGVGLGPRPPPVAGALRWAGQVVGGAPWRRYSSGNARCSTDQQDLTAQRDGLAALGVAANRVYVDHGLIGTNRERPGLREALAACREGDTLVVTKLDRLARSLSDARAIADELTMRQVRLSLGGSVYDSTDTVGGPLFNVLATVAESDLIRLRTREGMKVAKAKGRLRGKQPKLIHRQEAHLWPCFKAASTAPLDLPTCSASPARPSTGRWRESELATLPTSAPRSAEGSLVVSRRPPLRNSTDLLVSSPSDTARRSQPSPGRRNNSTVTIW
jgi:hypothetical protein